MALARLRRRGVAWGLALLALSVLASSTVGDQTLDLTLDSIDHPAVSAQQIGLRVDDADQRHAVLRIGTLRLGDRKFSQVVIDCPAFRWEGQLIDCRRGELRAAGQKRPIPLTFSYEFATQALEVVATLGAAERWRLTATGRSDKRRIEIGIENGDVESIAGWVPQMAGLRAKGRLNGTVAWQGKGAAGRLDAALRITEGAFSDALGTRAADRIGADLAVSAHQSGEAWNWRLQFAWDGGEALWAPWYFPAGGLRAELTGTYDPHAIRVTHGRLAMRDVGEATFEAHWARRAGAIERASFETGPIDLAAAAPLLIAPLLEQAAAPKLNLSGIVQGRGVIDSGRVIELDADLRGISAVEADQRFGLSGVTGPFVWRRDAPTTGALHVGGASFGEIALGGFDLPYRTRGMRFAVPKLDIPVLDGRLVIDNAAAALEGGNWRWQFGGSLYPVSMERLTEALGLPRMTGTMSASIPAVHHAESTITMDGALVIQVFDGYLSATDLKVIEPLGRVPRLQATLDARHIDLGQLTETFSFGSIAGYVDGYVKDMELAHWRPQKFDALITSSPGSYRKRISQRAVQNISALGGGGAAAAIQRSFLGFFEEFGYDTLGLSCSLRRGVCAMGGVAPATNGYVIVKGGGLPSITVIGYNRDVDWDELVARLKRVTETNATPIVK